MHLGSASSVRTISSGDGSATFASIFHAVLNPHEMESAGTQVIGLVGTQNLSSIQAD